MLAGLLPLGPEVSGRWGWSGSWIYPVGDPGALASESDAGGTRFRVVRGVSDRDSGGTGHQGADLSSGGGGGPVRAAGNGLVVAVGGKGWNRGYGRHVVLAHRSPDAPLVYSVYAHLAPGSVSVRPGQFVSAGRVIGRVGMSGRATSPHLHFEVRTATEPGTRWENVPVVDPLAFVAARLRAPRPDSGWAQPYLEWAECAALIRPGEPGNGPPSRADWWRTLAAATRQPLRTIPADVDTLRAALVTAGLLPADARGDPRAPLEWEELARDLGHARGVGWHLPWSPTGREGRRSRCRIELGLEAPGRNPAALAQGPGRPTRARLCLILADLAGDEPRPPTPPRPRPAPPVRQAGRDSVVGLTPSSGVRQDSARKAVTGTSRRAGRGSEPETVRARPRPAPGR